MSNLQHTDAVAAATAVLSGLEAKRVALLEHGRELVQQRQEISFDAHTGSAAAKKKLDAIIDQIATHEQQVLSVEAAIREAQNRVNAAERAAAAEADKARALALRGLLAEFVECGVSLQEAFTAIAEEGAALAAVVRQMHAHGCQFPTDQMVFVNGLLAVRSALQQTVWKREFSPVSPKDRRTWGSLTQEWAARIEQNYIAPHLGEEPAPAAAIPADLSVPDFLRRDPPPAEVQP